MKKPYFFVLSLAHIFRYTDCQHSGLQFKAQLLSGSATNYL